MTQKINDIEFSSPYKLGLIDSKIPKELKGDYTKLEIYSDSKNEQSTIVYSIELKNDDEIEYNSCFCFVYTNI